MKMDPSTCIQLASGAAMPIVGFGTWQIPADLIASVLPSALEAGYRLIDTANDYENEAAIGHVLKEKFDAGALKREELFIITKLNVHHMASRDLVRQGVEESLQALQLDYIDLFLIHMPCGQQLNPETDEGGSTNTPKYLDHVEVWKCLEEFADEGKLRSLGLSNFNSHQVARVAAAARHPISNLQIEAHAYFQQKELFNFCKERQISVTAYAGMGSPGRPPNWRHDHPILMEDEVVKTIADKHHKTPAQVLLRFMIQRGFAVIPKSVNPSRMQENFQVLKFSLDASDMLQLESLDRGLRYFTMHWFMDHPDYPFHASY